MAQEIFQAEAKTTKKKNTWNPLLGKLQVSAGDYQGHTLGKAGGTGALAGSV